MLISFAVTAKLICVFVFAHAKCWFSHDAAQMVLRMCPYIDHCFDNGSYKLNFKCLARVCSLKLRSHRANGRVTDKKLFYPFVSVRIRSLSVSHPVTPFLFR